MAKCKHGEENCVRCGLEGVDVPPIHVHFILDVSPSMRSLWSQTLSGVNEYFDSLRNDKETKYKVTLTTFSGEINVPYKDVDPDSIPKFTNENLRPHGYGTAIYDAVGQTLEAIDTTDPVLVVIYTDGEENSSRTFNEKSVSDASKTAEAKGNFTFLYMGADKAAWGKAHVFGASQANSRDFAATGSLRAASFSSLASGSAGYAHTVRSLHASSKAGGPSLNLNKVSYFNPDQTATVTNTIPDSTGNSGDIGNDGSGV